MSNARRRYQFRLRGLLIATTLIAMGLGVYAHSLAVERDQVRRVDAFNLAMDQQRYDDAGLIAQAASKRYPHDKLMQFMVYKWQFVGAVMRGEEPEYGFVCQIVDDEQSGFEASEATMKSWKDLSRRRRAP